MSEERDPDEVFEVLCSDHSREILVAASSEPCSAQDLAEHCEISLPTVYRRVNNLVEQDLLEEQLRVDPEGNHYHLYISNFNAVQFEIEERRFVANLRLKRDVIDRFGELWRGLGAYSDENTQD